MSQSVQLQQLLEADKFEDAKALINSILDESNSVNDAGAKAFAVMQVYIEAMTAINTRYERALKEAIDDLTAAHEINELLSQKASAPQGQGVAA